MNFKTTTLPLSKTLLALAIGSTVQSAQAATVEGASKNQEDTLVVQATGNEFTPGGNTLVPAFLDGQVANGGRLGMLGEQNAMDVPFNVIGFTAKLIEDQQAKTVADVVNNDASVQNVQGYGNYAETYRIRGFKLDGDDMTFGGLAGVLPRQVVDTAMIERVEVFKGANSLVNGAASSGVGGMINLEPKHATDTPVTRVGVDYASASQVGVSTDIGRRFGDSNQFGARVNLLHREGESPIENDKRRTTLASLGLDYKGDKLRTSLDMGYQKKTFHGGPTGINIANVSFIPDTPRNTSNYSQKWAFSDIENEFGLARAEYDFADDWTAYLGFGAQHTHEKGTYSSPKLINRDGDATAGRMDTNAIRDSASGMGGIRGEFDTGFVSHKVNVGYSALLRRDDIAWTMNSRSPAARVNIYQPDDVAMPYDDLKGGHYSDPLTTGRTRVQGWLLSDTLGVLDDTLLFTLGARHQKVVLRNYSNATGAETPNNQYDQSRWMPTYGVVYKAWNTVSFYANHTEALQPGPTAPSSTQNYGQSLGIARSKQNEVGVKMDFGRVGGALALYEIKKPSAISVPSGVAGILPTYTLDGEQRNRGVELSAFGEPVLGLRLNGSATWIDAELTKTQGGVNNGKTPTGVPSYFMVLGAEYDIKPLNGLTATARINNSGAQYANATNSKKIGGYTTLDLGVRYKMQLNQDRNEMTWRVGVDNVTNENYWASVDDSGTYIFQGEPRTLKVSMSYDF